MPTTSSYLRYLPPVLWSTTANGSLTLGTFLCIFEKFLTGLDDNVAAPAPDIKSLIDNLAALYDPWQTPANFLPWLASWVDLTLPADWDEYRCRRAISDMVNVYQQRSSRDGLARLFYLGTDGPQMTPNPAGNPAPSTQIQFPDLKPRIAIDDGNKLMAAQLDPQAPVLPFTLQAQGPYWKNHTLFMEGLIAPQCLAIAPDGSLFVADNGYSYTGSLGPQITVAPRLWQLNSVGDYPFAGGKPQPLQQINPTTGASTDWTFQSAIGIAVLGSVASYLVCLLDREVTTTGATATISYTLYLLPSTTGFTARPFSTVPPAPPWPPSSPGVTFTPVAMTSTATAGELLILDRGTSYTSTSPANPGIVIIENIGSSQPPNFQRVAVANVTEPLSITPLANGDYLVGDAATGGLVLVQVNRSTPTWTATSSPVAITNSPLVAPTCLLATPSGDVLVLDTGLRPARPDPSNPFWPVVANPAAVYRIHLATTPATATLAVTSGRLVYPQTMALAGTTLYLCDPGMPMGAAPQSWRIFPSRIGVVVHIPGGATQNAQAINTVLGAIRNVMNQELPAHVFGEILTQSASTS